MRSMPLQLSPVRAGRHAVRQLDLVLPQVTQQAAEAAQGRELVQDQPHDVLHLLVGIELQFAVRPDHVARRGLAQPFAAAGAVQASGLHPLLDLMQFDPSHEALDGQDEAIVEILRMVQAVLVGQQGVEGRTDLDQAATGLVLAGEAIDLKAEHQADVAEGDLREQPGEIVAADGGGGGAPLIAIEDANAFGGPTPGEGAVVGDWPGPGRIRGGVGPAGDGIGGHRRWPSVPDGARDLGGSLARPGVQRLSSSTSVPAGSGAAEVLEQQRGQLDQQAGLQLWRQLLPARNRLAEGWRSGGGGGGRSGGVGVSDIGGVPP